MEKKKVSSDIPDPFLKLTGKQRQNAELIKQACADNGIDEPEAIGYILATAEHESNFRPTVECEASKARWPAHHPASEKETYFGRGFVQLTFRANYQAVDALLGLKGKLIKDPDLALQPDIAAQILVRGMKEGTFTGAKLAHYFNDLGPPNYVQARKIVNGLDCAKSIAQKAKTYANYLLSQQDDSPKPKPKERDYLRKGDVGKDVAALQEILVKKGLMQEEDLEDGAKGIFGPKTEGAVARLQSKYLSAGVMQEEDLENEKLGVYGPRTKIAISDDNISPKSAKPSEIVPGCKSAQKEVSTSQTKISKSASAPKPIPKTNLEKGNSGPDVEKLQDILVEKGYMLPSDFLDGGKGHYGPKTKMAVGELQEDYVERGLMNAEDLEDGAKGCFGPKTRSALLEDYKERLNPTH